MSSWNEDNFLEKLTPRLRQEPGTGQNPCPDAATICAVMDDEVGGWLHDLFSQHVAQCSACSDLYGRLRNFESGDSPVREAEWRRVQQRLDIWFDNSFGTNAGYQQTMEPPCFTALQGFSRGWFSALPWALGAVTAMALIAGVFLTGRGPSAPPQAQIAGRARAPQMQPANPKPAEAVVERPNGEKAAATQAKARPKHVAPPGGSGPPPETAGSGTPTEAAELSGPSIPPLSPSAPTSNNRADQSGNRNGRVVFGTGPWPNAETAASRPPSPVVKAPSVARAGLAPRPPADAAASPRETPAPQAPPVQPVPIPLEAGARLWIRLSSTDRQPDGSFSFRGSLLLPVTEAGTTLLDRGTEVQGSGRTDQGRTSLVVKEFVLKGVRYVLQDGGSVGSEKSPGSGGAVSFEGGQVFEMWFAAASTYETVAGERTPQK